MATQNVPTVKNITLSGEDTRRKERMIRYLKDRGMLSPEGEKFIRKGKR